MDNLASPPNPSSLANKKKKELFFIAKLFLLVFITVSNIAFAACTFTSLTEASPSNQIDNGVLLGPVRDQDGVGWCYAYGAADILEQWLKKKKIIPANENISAVALAIKDQSRELSFYHRQYHIDQLIEQGISDPQRWAEQRYQQYQQQIDQLRKPMDDSFSLALKEISALNARVAEIKNQIQTLEPNLSESFESQNLLSELRDQQRELSSLSRQKTREALNWHDERNFFREQPQILEQLNQLKEEQEYYKILKFSSPSSNPSFPRGGNAITAIERSWPNICFETEVSSRDLIIVDELTVSLKKALEQMSKARFEHEGCLDCVEGSYAIQVFPGIGNIQDVINTVERLKPHQDGFSQLIDQSCADKSFATLEPPQIVEESIKDKIPLDPTASQLLFQHIDNALNSRKIATISYHSSILSQESFPLSGRNYDDDHHLSVITGSMTICGQTYYKLRNSWGGQSCQNYQKKMINSRGSHQNLPYICDEEGNYIVKKSHLQKGLLNVSYIQN